MCWLTEVEAIFITGFSNFDFLLIKDQLRWQPWVYIYTLILLPYLFSKRPPLFYFQVLFIGIYFWSGVHKLNADFPHYIFLKMMHEVFGLYLAKYLWLAFFIPAVEIAIAFGLIWSKTRGVTCFLALVTHLFIMYWLLTSPSISNSIVIPWNLAMILLIFPVFYGQSLKLPVNFNGEKRFLAGLALFVIIAPVFNFFGQWDNYFSFDLYSGKSKHITATIETSNLKTENYGNLSSFIIEDKNRVKYLNFHKWAVEELNVPIPSEQRVFRALAKTMCEKTNLKIGDFKIWHHRNTVEHVFSCSALY